VANKRGPDRKRPEFWSEAVKRINAGESVTALAQELGVKARRLYWWREKLEPREKDPRRQREAVLAAEVRKLKQALADKVLEADFLRGALHKVEERRRSSGGNGGAASTTRSGK
jgi:Transposase